ncbi:uncharacterized protein LOC117636699 [Prunus dulcis]|uniref:uncharacterized protein LOC117636699 n=1 Tax=Prunus dulcis TaxID=3755 RepID=UPI00148268ED|nr:uncharacterized protein LOC117636699 [Prunus dulcis]
MEGVSTSMYKGLRGYWRRRGYEKLSGSGGLTELRSGGKRRARRIRIKIKMGRKLKLSFLRIRRMPSPKKLLVWLRDAYVKLMLGFANSGMFSTGYGGPMCDYGTGSFGKGPLKEYDEKMIVEIYKSLMLAQGRDAAKFGSEIVSRR